jgi:hypothetical protein
MSIEGYRGSRKNRLPKRDDARSWSQNPSGERDLQRGRDQDMAKDEKSPSPPRVYFIGAGFSAGLYYPTGRDLMRSLVGYLRGEPQDDDLEEYGFDNSVLQSDRSTQKRAKQILGVIERVLQEYFAIALADIGRVDVAEFFTMAHTLSESPWLLEGSGITGHALKASSGDDPPSKLTLFTDLTAVTRSYFNDIGMMLPPSEDIKSILETMDHKGDAIINFNWDEEVDLELTQTDEQGISYTLGDCREDGGVLTLKPHGSVGWYDAVQGIGNTEAYFIANKDPRIGRAQKRILAYDENEQPLDIDGETEHSPLTCPPVITAPTFSKRFDYIEQQRIWQDVLEICGKAREFVFLGYSLPRDDFLTRAAIRSAIQANDRDQELKCLVVDKSFDDAKFINFESVFEGLTRNRNFFQWEFGQDDPQFAAKLKKKLKDALILRAPAKRRARAAKR